MNQEIIDLLEKGVIKGPNIKIYDAIFDFGKCYMILQENYDQALVLLKQQPTAGEFTRKFRVLLANQDKTAIVQDAYELCARLDIAEARLKDLLEVCEGLMEKADDGSADFDDPEPGSIYLKAKAIIAKTK